MKIVELTPVPSVREGVVATESGKTEKGYLYQPNDIIVGKYVIDRRSYNTDYTEQSNTDGKVTFVKTRKMSAISKDSLLDNLDEFNSHISKPWLDIVKAKGIEAGDDVAYIEDGKLMLVTSERISEVPSDSTILFNIDENGKYYNVYYCQNEKLKSLYVNANEVLN